MSKQAKDLPYLKTKVLSSAQVFTKIQDEFTFAKLNEVVPSTNYHLGNITELEALRDFFTETIKESNNVSIQVYFPQNSFFIRIKTHRSQSQFGSLTLSL